MNTVLTKLVKDCGKYEIRKALPADVKTPAFLFVCTTGEDKKIIPHLFVQVQRKHYRNKEIIDGAADELESMVNAIKGNILNDLYTEGNKNAEDRSV